MIKRSYKQGADLLSFSFAGSRVNARAARRSWGAPFFFSFFFSRASRRTGPEEEPRHLGAAEFGGQLEVPFFWAQKKSSARNWRPRVSFRVPRMSSRSPSRRLPLFRRTSLLDPELARKEGTSSTLPPAPDAGVVSPTMKWEQP